MNFYNPFKGNLKISSIDSILFQLSFQELIILLMPSFVGIRSFQKIITNTFDGNFPDFFPGSDVRNSQEISGL